MCRLLDSDSILKICIRLADVKTFMAENSAFWLNFRPYLSVSVKKQKIDAKFGYEGGIEYRGDPFISHINIQRPSSWLPPEPAIHVTKKHPRRTKIPKKRSNYQGKDEKATHKRVMFVLKIFWSIMAIAFVMLIKVTYMYIHVYMLVYMCVRTCVYIYMYMFN